MLLYRWHKRCVIIFFFLLSCRQSLPTFDEIDFEVWKRDKLACNGQRSQMSEAMEAQSEKLVALNEQEIISLLGKPDENELYKRNQKFYYYFLQPSRECSESPVENPKKLVIRFNAIGLAKEVTVE